MACCSGVRSPDHGFADVGDGAATALLTDDRELEGAADDAPVVVDDELTAEYVDAGSGGESAALFEQAARAQASTTAVRAADKCLVIGFWHTSSFRQVTYHG